MNCSTCHQAVPAGAARCPSCGQAMPATAVLAAATPVSCARCGRPMAAETAFCPACGAGRAGAGLAPTRKSPAFALLLSFIWAGLGQLYNGDVSKGCTLAVAYFIAYVLMPASGGLAAWIVVCIWVGGMYDAYQTAKRRNQAALAA